MASRAAGVVRTAAQRQAPAHGPVRSALGGLRYASAQTPTTSTPATPPAPGSTPPVTPERLPPVVPPTAFKPNNSRSSKGSPLFGRLASYTLFVFGSTFLVVYYLDARSAIHRWVAMPFLHTFLDPEEAQKLAIRLLQSGLAPRDYTGEDEALEAELFGHTIVNPIGLAAGFDKQGEAIDALFNLGFGLVEIGSVTPEPQPGNPLPRYFRLPSHSASINRFGFNSDGHTLVLARLMERVREYLILHPELIPSNYLPDPRSPDADPRVSRRQAIVNAAEDITSQPHLVAHLLDQWKLPQRSLHEGRLLGINLGKNKTSAEDDPSDFVRGVSTFGPFADYLVVNVSSPNTPGLRDLQKREALVKLLREVVTARDRLPERAQGEGQAKRRVPLVLKISPDLSSREFEEVTDVILASKGIDGVVVSNTTVSRPITSLPSDSPEWSTLREAGGLSGPPLRPLARQALKSVVGKLRGAGIEVLGCGGITTPEDVLQATTEDGASAVQVYTAFGWQGVGMVSRWKEEMRGLLAKRRDTGQEGAGQATSPTYKFLSHQILSTLRQSEEERKSRNRQDLKEEIKSELEKLRKEHGIPASPAGTAAADSSVSQQSSGNSVFWPEEKDTAYNSLLRESRRALGIDEPTRPQPAALGQPTQEAGDKVPPAIVLQGGDAAGGGGGAVEDKGTKAERTVEVVGSVGDEYTRGAANTGSSTAASRDWREYSGVDKGRRV